MLFSSLPKFAYETPVLDASQAVVLDNILAGEIKSSCDSLGFFDFVKLPALFIPWVVSIVSAFALFASKGNELVTFFVMLVMVFSWVAIVAGLFAVPVGIFGKIALGAVPARDEAVANWILARYGVNILVEDVSDLVDGHKAKSDSFVRSGGTFIHFQTVTNEGELLFDSSGIELQPFSFK